LGLLPAPLAQLAEQVTLNSWRIRKGIADTTT